MIRSVTIIFFVVLLLSGCSTASLNKAGKDPFKGEYYKEVKDSLEAVAEGVAGKKLSDAELKKLEKDLRSDPETKSAVQAITNSITNENVKMKYCPVCGKRYSPDMEYCPEDHAKLKILE